MKQINYFFAVLLLQTALFSTSAFSMGKRVPHPTANDPQVAVQGLKFQKQEKENWCWAATSRILLSLQTQNPPSQCQIASRTLGVDCCSIRSRSAGKCLNGNDPQRALAAYGIRTTSRVPNYDRVVSLIKKGEPVIIVHTMMGATDIKKPADFGNGKMVAGAHAVVVYGTYYKNNQDYLLIYDPYIGGYRFWSKEYILGNLQWISTIEVK